MVLELVMQIVGDTAVEVMIMATTEEEEEKEEEGMTIKDHHVRMKEQEILMEQGHHPSITKRM